MDRDQAFSLVCERIEATNLRNHCVATEIIMAALARRFGMDEGDVARWAMAGLMHDLDYAETAEDFARHGLVTAELLTGELDGEQLHAILAHASKADRDTLMDKALYSADPATGFIVAAALVRPDKSLANVEVRSLLKRWKEKAFARGADREQMAACEELGLSREEFLEIALCAMQARAADIGL